MPKEFFTVQLSHCTISVLFISVVNEPATCHQWLYGNTLIALSVPNPCVRVSRSMSQNATSPPKRRPKSFNSCGPEVRVYLSAYSRSGCLPANKCGGSGPSRTPRISSSCYRLNASPSLRHLCRASIRYLVWSKERNKRNCVDVVVGEPSSRL